MEVFNAPGVPHRIPVLEDSVKRKPVSKTKRLALFKRKNGICHICLGPVQEGQAWELSHEIPLELGGKDDESNWSVAHKKCHRHLTAKVDIPTIAKAKRREAKHLGVKTEKPKIANRGFDKDPPKEKKPSLPPRALYR